MPATQVPIGLNKQAAGDTAWDVALNAGIDEANVRLTYSGTLSPEGLLLGRWLGHRYFQRTHVAFWIYTNPVLNTTTGWVREIAQGVITMWSGLIANIPAGWVLCNGVLHAPTGYTPPNLSGKFIVGYDAADPDYDAPGDTGGEKTHILSVAEMPSHDHGGATGGPSVTLASRVTGLNTGGNPGEAGTASAHTHTISAQGGGAAHENRPPYYTLAYIAKL